MISIALADHRHLIRESDRSPETAVVLLSMYAGDQYVIEALRSGASGYVGTPARSIELIRAIRKAAAGDRDLSAPLSERRMETCIASRLSIGRRTAESHRASIMRKLRLGNQIDLVRFAIARGFLALPSDPLRHADRGPGGRRRSDAGQFPADVAVT